MAARSGTSPSEERTSISYDVLSKRLMEDSFFAAGPSQGLRATKPAQALAERTLGWCVWMQMAIKFGTNHLAAPMTKCSPQSNRLLTAALLSVVFPGRGKAETRQVLILVQMISGS